MQRQFDSRAEAAMFRCGLALLVLLGWLVATASGQEERKAGPATPNPAIHATHVLGFETVNRNTGGELSIQDDALQFRGGEMRAVEISIASIRNVSLGEDDKQVGGVPMMLGKSAVPFGGGRAISLFSHKKYDSLTVEYIDASGGLHGAIFRMKKGAGQTFRDDLITRRAQLKPQDDAAPNRAAASGQDIQEESLNGPQKWSVVVEKVDPGDTNLDPCFADAIYENTVKELIKSNQFRNVFRSGDRSATDASGVLYLKTIVTKYNPGSETKRAVTTVAGATKLNVKVQLLTRDGHLVMEREIHGNVRFFGDNLGATNKVAHNAVKTLAKSSLPEAFAPEPQKTTEAGALVIC